MPDDTIIQFPDRRTEPTEATKAFLESLRSRRHATKPQASQCQINSLQVAWRNDTIQDPAAPNINSGPSETSNRPDLNAFIDDGFDELREWCETKRTCWPTELGTFLSYCEFMLAKDLEEPNSGRGRHTRRDYSWVPSVLCDIFHSTLEPAPMLHILEYFLSLLSMMILADSTTVADHATIYHDYLLRTVAPSQGHLPHEPDYLGALNPPDILAPSIYGLKSNEIELLSDIRRQLYLHLLEPR